MFWLATHMWGLLITAFGLGAAIGWWVWGRLSNDLDLARRDASDLRAGNETLRSKVDRLEPLVATKETLEKRIETLDVEISEKSAELSAVQGESADLKRQLEALPGLRAEAGEASRLRERLEALTGEQSRRETRIASLEEALLHAKGEKDAAQTAAQKLSVEVSQLGEAKRTVEQRFASAETGYAAERKTLAERATALARTAETAERSRRELENRIAELSQKLTAETALRQPLERRIAELQLRLDAAEADRDALRAKLKVLKTNMKMIVAAAEQNGEALERLRGELRQVSSATDQAEARAAELIADIERARTDVRNAERDAEAMRRRWSRAASLETGDPVQPKLHRAPVSGAPDELTRIAGITAETQRRLQAIGVFYIGQIAAWSRGETAWIDNRLGLDKAAGAWAHSARRLITGENDGLPANDAGAEGGLA